MIILSTYKSNCCIADTTELKSAIICDKCKNPCSPMLISEKYRDFNDKQVEDEAQI
jgi:hypothetical protein